MKEIKHLGAYGILVEDGKILLIKKFGGPYDSKLDLPGGTIEFGEAPEEAFKREMLEEVGIEVSEYQLFDSDSVTFSWQVNDGAVVKVHHIGIFYKIVEYNNEIKKEVEIDMVNDDSMGADFYDINLLSENNLSKIAVLELNKLGYDIK